RARRRRHARTRSRRRRGSGCVPFFALALPFFAADAVLGGDGTASSAPAMPNNRSFFDFYVVSAMIFWRTRLPRRVLFPVRADFFYDHAGAALGRRRSRARRRAAAVARRLAPARRTVLRARSRPAARAAAA